MAPLTSCLVSGIFAIEGGRRETEKPFYVTYLSTLDFVDPENFLDVSVRNYSPLTEGLYADGSLVFMVAKAAFLSESNGMLESVYCVPFDDSMSDDYLPFSTTKVASVTGAVTSVNNGVPNQSFALSVTAYICGDQSFHIRFEYNGTSKRWRNTRLPLVGSMVVAIGTFKRVSREGCILELLDITFGPLEATPVSPTRSIRYHKTNKTSDQVQRSSSLRSVSPEAVATSPTRKVGYRKARNASSERQPPSPSLVASNLPPEVENTPAMAGTSKSHSKRAIEEIDGAEGDSQQSRKRLRSRKGKGKEKE